MCTSIAHQCIRTAVLRRVAADRQVAVDPSLRDIFRAARLDRAVRRHVANLREPSLHHEEVEGSPRRTDLRDDHGRDR